MRYYKQLHKRKYIHLIAISISAICFSLAFTDIGLDSRIMSFSCGVVFLVCGWIMRKGRTHYIEINDEKIIHRGFRQWTIHRSDIIRIERGRKGWLDNSELYLKIISDKNAYDVDDGFLKDEQQIQELTKVIGSR